ncbi:WD40 repeat domain-containing protein [Actinomycetes bacterium KLBMP 9797]
MTSSDVDRVVHAVLRRRLPWRTRNVRIAVVPQEPGPDVGAGLVVVGRRVLADPRIRRRFGAGTGWMVNGPDSDASQDLRYHLLVQLTGPTPFHYWILRWEKVLRRYRRLLLVIDDTGAGWSAANLFSGLRGHVNLLLSSTADGRPNGAEAVAVDTAAAVGAARDEVAARLGSLARADAERVAELAVFVAGDPVPAGLVRSLWRLTGGLEPATADDLARRAGGPVTVDAHGRVTLDPVAHAVLRHDRSPGFFADLGAALLDDVAARLPRARPLIAIGPDRAWWELDPANGYLWEHLVRHLVAAGRPREAELLAGDLRWVTARLLHTDPGGPLRDFGVVAPAAADAITGHLREAYRRAAGRLDPVQPPHPPDALAGILHNVLRYPNDSRYRPNPWPEQVRAVEAHSPGHRLVPRWRPDDDPQDGRTLLPGSFGLDVSPDGRVLAVAGDSKFVTCTDLATGETVAMMKCYSKSRDVVFGPDGTWVALRTWDNHFPTPVEDPPESSTVQVWTIRPTVKRFQIEGRYRSHIRRMAVSPDGRLLVTWHDDTMRMWDARTGALATDTPTADPQAWQRVHVRSAASPDGAWRAEIHGAELRLWDLAADRPGPVTRSYGDLHGLRWLPDGILTYGSYGITVYDVQTATESREETRSAINS